MTDSSCRVHSLFVFHYRQLLHTGGFIYKTCKEEKSRRRWSFSSTAMCSYLGGEGKKKCPNEARREREKYGEKILQCDTHTHTQNHLPKLPTRDTVLDYSFCQITHSSKRKAPHHHP